jgi:hypothetical protein
MYGGMIPLALSHKISYRQAQRGGHGLRIATGMTMKQYTSGVTLGHGKRSVFIVMGRTLRYVTASALFYALQALQNVR